MFEVAFHGTAAHNLHSILRSGLQTLSGTAHQANGAARGAGVLVMLNCAQDGQRLVSHFEALNAPPASRTLPRRAARMDLRTYGVGAQILRDLGVGRMRLLSAPRRMPSMTGYDLQVVGFESQP